MGDGRANSGMARAVDSAAAACLGAAVAVSILLLGDGGIAGLAAGALTWFAARRALGRIGGAPMPFAVPDFAPAPVEIAAAPELLLTPDQIVADEALLLDDELAGPAADARVVRLFDPAAIPTAGELQRRIDRHLRVTSPPLAVPDDSGALHEALAVLRRSLGAP